MDKKFNFKHFLIRTNMSIDEYIRIYLMQDFKQNNLIPLHFNLWILSSNTLDI